MSFIASKLGTLITGADAEKALLAISDELKKEIANGTSWSTAIQNIQVLFQGNALKEKLIDLLKQKLEQGDLDIFRDLVESVENLSAKTDRADRQVGWPNKEWSTNQPVVGPLSLDLQLSGGAWFEIHSQSTKREKPLPEIKANHIGGQLSFLGKAAAGIKGNGTVIGAAIEGGVNGSLERALHYHFSYTDKTFLAGKALAKALGSVRLPWDFDTVWNTFEEEGASSLDAIEISGGEGLAANAKIAFSFPAGPGGLGISLGGKLSLGNNFRQIITCDANQANPKKLTLAVMTKSTEDKGYEVGLSYKVGISSLLPGGAKGLINQASKAGELIDELDKLTEGAETWLKPGSLLKDEINGWLNEALTEAADDDYDNDTKRRAFETLGILFGVDDADVLADQTKTDIKDATSDLVADIVDDTLDIFDLAETPIGDKALSAIIGKADSEVKKLLEDKVFSKIVPAINKKLSDTFNSADVAVKTTLSNMTKSIFGIDSDDPVADLRKALQSTRGILSDIIEGLESVVDEMLAIEFGFAQEKFKSKQFDLSVDFEATARQEYKRAILSPRKLGDFLLSQNGNLPNGVEVTSFLQDSYIKRSSTSSFGLSIGSVSLAASTKVTSDARIIRTNDGIVIAGFSNGKITKKSSLLGETRELSFITATSINNLAKLNNSVTTGDIQAGTYALAADIPTATPKLSLNFSENDGNLKTKEAEKLMDRFVDAGMIEPSVAKAVEAAVKKARKAAGGKDLEANLAIALAIPPTRILDVLEYGASNTTATIETTMHALANTHPNSIIDAVGDTGMYGETPNTIMSALEDQNLLSANTPAHFSHGSSQKKSRRAQIAFEMLHNIDTIIDASRNTAIASFDRRSGDGRYVTANAFASERTNSLVQIQQATKALQQTLAIGHYIYTQLRSNIVTEAELEKHQANMVSAMKPLLRVGIPLPSWLGGKVPKRTVALYQALQNICAAALKGPGNSEVSLTPPLIIQLKVKGKSAETFIG